MKNSKVVLASVFALFMLAACSGSTSAPASSSAEGKVVAPVAEAQAPDACKLLTKEIVESVVGPVGEADTKGSGYGNSNCMYVAENFSGASLYIKPYATPQSFKESMDAMKGVSGVDSVKVDGVGEAAFWAGGKLNQFNVLKNGNWMIFTAFAAKDPEAITKKLADKVLATM